jgi:(2R)-sulfolactate sulfo-lyase subunit alpha
MPQKEGEMLHFLIHGKDDNVAVAVTDVKKGQRGQSLNMAKNERSEIEAVMDIPLGHKIALREFKVDDTIIKYDNDIGRVVSPIKRGEHVHVHNVKTKKW